MGKILKLKVRQHLMAENSVSGTPMHVQEDVRLMYEMGLDAYRFSISWSRLIPDGRGAINPKGLEYYNSLINELRHYGIEPHVTLYHFDLPQSLEDAYGGWLSSQIIEDFKAYAEVCFREFGDRVKYWTTFNEPAFTVFGYDWGSWPPQRCSFPFGWGNCTAGNSKVEPYIATHHVLLSHAEAVSVYREKFQEKHKGLIGLALFTAWFERMTNTTKDFVATQRTLIFQFGWFLDPIVYGDYHSLIKEMVGSRLPTFSKQQSKKLKASFDFIGVIHYNTFYVSDAYWPPGERDYPRDMLSTVSELRDGIPIAKLAPSGLAIVPWGMQAILEYFKQQYGNPPVIAYENGYATANNESLSLLDALNDQPRVDYLHDYLGSLLSAIRNGSNAQGYFVWSFVDLFEFLYGYEFRYGLFFVDFKDEKLKRYPTLSARWYTEFLKGSKHIDFVEEKACSHTQ
ncbi:beta-glucosidase 22 isoform X3 [Cryptomeria japonica]|uniref:beta-glucosidase 22 isoform X3 n=2 Tax=Cryptomeria japonica TaxID=3369 RepID=UPI0025AB7723|nr:beta-glucosidase 22 isoform X3 [Cryptomeria japonica]